MSDYNKGIKDGYKEGYKEGQLDGEHVGYSNGLYDGRKKEKKNVDDLVEESKKICHVFDLGYNKGHKEGYDEAKKFFGIK